MTLTPGTHLGPYEIIALLGAGGMGEVWKARDTRLGRIVAIKRLTGRHTERFEQEARAIAALNHPHICQIYDVGTDYLVLEYVEGQPLRGPLPADEAVRLALQIASALEEAHRHGILHRDLKPANIMVTGRSVSASSGATIAKLLDFGLAKLITADADVTRTAEGTVVGTAAYMSPEQAEGRTLDARSDIFSFGAVLYEMLSGTRAFAGHTAAQVLSAVLRDDPAPLPHAPSAIDRMVRRCLSKDRGNRFQTMQEVKTALEEASTKPGDRQPSIAVLPFANMSGDQEQEYFSDGLAEEIINALTHIPGLKVTARTSAFAFRGSEQDITKIAAALRVTTVLEGSVRRAGNRIRVTAQLINAEDGYHLWSERFDRELADVFAIQDEIAQAIARSLQLTLVGPPADRPHTPQLPAYDAVLRGRHHLFKLSPETWMRAKACFEQAIALDPVYADAHAYLSLGYFFMGMNGILPLRDVAHLVRAEAQKALDLNPSEIGPRFLLGGIAAAYDYDWKMATPTVSLTAPASGASVVAGTATTISASATAATGHTIASVSFYAGSTLLGTDTTSPYSLTWTPTAGGSYSLTAKATDNSGSIAQSAARIGDGDGPRQGPRRRLPASGVPRRRPAPVVRGGGARAGGEVPLGQQRIHYRHPLLQVLAEHWHARRPPVVGHRHAARFGDLHQRRDVGLAGRELCLTDRHHREHDVCRVLSHQCRASTP